MTFGYAIFADVNFSSLARVVVSALLRHSKNYVYIECFGWDMAPAERLVIKTQKGTFQYRGGFSQYEQSIATMLNSPFEFTCCLDADTIVTKHIDDIFGYASENHPMQMVHPHNPSVLNDCRWIMEKLGVTRALSPYCHRSPFLFHKSSRQYIESALHQFNLLLKDNPINSNFHDERFLAAWRWKNGISTAMPYVILDSNAFHNMKECDYVLGFHGQKNIELAVQWQNELSK